MEFRNAVKETGRKKLIMRTLWTEVCLTFPALDALVCKLQRDWKHSETVPPVAAG